MSGAAGPGGRRREPAPLDWRKTIRSRLIVCAAALGLWTTGIEARLVYLQVFDHADLMDRADRQQNRTFEPAGQARRDLRPQGTRPGLQRRRRHHRRRSRLKSTTRPRSRRRVAPRSTAAPPSAAQAIAKSLAKRSSFAYVARQVTPGRGEARPRARALPGITLLKESRRYYPNSELAAHVVGYVGLDNVGLGGIESAYDSQIRGKAGKILIQTDAKRHAIFSRVERPATAGAGVELTIDQYLQYVAERELRVGVEENRALAGTAIIMDPRTGEILALANWPTFNPNAFAKADEDDAAGTARSRASTSRDRRSRSSPRRRRSSSRSSTPETMIETSPGSITFPGRKPIYDTHHYGLIPFTDVIVKSSNVGAIKVGLQLGRSGSATTSRASGSARRSVPTFAARRAGIVWNPAQLNDSALGVGLDGLPGRRDAAADGDGGEHGGQRRTSAAAARRARVHQGRPRASRCRTRKCSRRSPRHRRRR